MTVTCVYIKFTGRKYYIKSSIYHYNPESDRDNLIVKKPSKLEYNVKSKKIIQLNSADFKKLRLENYNWLTNNGTNPLSDDFYEAIAWQGLKSTGVKAWVDLPQSRKDALNKALSDYIFRTTSNCPN